MENLGIIGTGKNAAKWYLEKCREIYQLQHGSNVEPPVKLKSVPFEPINAILPDQMKEAGRLLVPYLREMDDFDVSRFILANITLHEAVELQNVSLKTPFISLRTVIANHWDSDIKKVMIVGSYYTMQGNYLPSLFVDFDLDFIAPSEKDFTAIDQLRKKYYKSSKPKDSRTVFDQLKMNYPEVDSFIIACTEHALALADYQKPIRSFNLPELQCLELITSKIT